MGSATVIGEHGLDEPETASDVIASNGSDTAKLPENSSAAAIGEHGLDERESDADEASPAAVGEHEAVDVSEPISNDTSTTQTTPLPVGDRPWWWLSPYWWKHSA